MKERPSGARFISHEALISYYGYVKLPSFPFVVLDTETTGFIPKVHRIIEFASVRVENGKVADTYETLIAIPDPVPPHIQVLTRIKQDDLSGKPVFDDVRDTIQKQIGKDTVIIGQNVGFDINMLKGEGIDLSDRLWLDTSMIASLVFPELESYSLGYMSQVLPLNHEPVHRAMGDVHATLELLEKCWERLSELTPDLSTVLQNVMKKAPEQYRIFFSDLPVGKAKKNPKWLTIPKSEPHTTAKKSVELVTPEKGTVNLLEESLDPAFFDALVTSALKQVDQTHWIAVKNLSAYTRRANLPKSVSILRPGFQLLDYKAVEKLSAQPILTTDEATIATKLAWYEPYTIDDLPIHGDERFVWAGKLACTESCKEYTEQLQRLSNVVLLDHRQLLSILNDPEHPANKVLSDDAHIIIDDASMLEDTATKAYGWYSSSDDLRAASAGNPVFSRFVDVLQLWIEKTRNYQDVRYIIPADLQSADARGLREQLAELLKSPDISDQAREQLKYLGHIIDPETSAHRIEWIELRQDGKQMLQSVPDRVSSALEESLYKKYAVTLCIPPESDATLTEVVAPNIDTNSIPQEEAEKVPLTFAPQNSPQDVLNTPREGKTVLLVASKKLIETIYINYAEKLEEQGITLICQGLSGGQGRMQAEYIAAKGTAILVTTPWTFETFELHQNTIDHLVLDTLPFDHPSHAVISKRAEHYQNAFEQYSLPRLEHRLFRLLRTFCRYATSKRNVLILDDRLESKSYGRRIKEYLNQFVGEATTTVEIPKTSVKKSSTKKQTVKTKKETDQLKLF